MLAWLRRGIAPPNAMSWGEQWEQMNGAQPRTIRASSSS